MNQKENTPTLLSHDEIEDLLAGEAGSFRFARKVEEAVLKKVNTAAQAVPDELGRERCTMSPSEHVGTHWCDNQSSASAAQPSEQAHTCETCDGKGTIDETLGGEGFSSPKAECPECGGNGEWYACESSPDPALVAQPSHQAQQPTDLAHIRQAIGRIVSGEPGNLRISGGPEAFEAAEVLVRWMRERPTSAPGHTDLMVSPESLDEYLRDNPPTEAELADAPKGEPSDTNIMAEWAATPNTGDMRVDLVAFARSLLARYAAPVDAAAIRNAALEEAAGAVEKSPGLPVWAESEDAIEIFAEYIRALKTDQQEQK